MDCRTPPNVVNGALNIRLVATTFQETATYTCNSGYTAQGEQRTRTCLANGQWSESDLVCRGESHSCVHYDEKVAW